MESCWKVMLCTRPVPHTGCHHLGPFHDCRSYRRHCHWDWSQLCQEELLDFHASETWLEIELHLNTIVTGPVIGYTFILQQWKLKCIYFSSWLQFSHIYIYPHTLCEHVHIPATSIPQKKTSRIKPTINTSPTMVPTAIPAMAPEDKSGRAVGREIDASILVYPTCMGTA